MWEEASAAFGQFSCEPKAVLNNNVNLKKDLRKNMIKIYFMINEKAIK